MYILPPCPPSYAPLSSVLRALIFRTVLRAQWGCHGILVCMVFLAATSPCWAEVAVGPNMRPQCIACTGPTCGKWRYDLAVPNCMLHRVSLFGTGSKVFSWPLLQCIVTVFLFSVHAHLYM